MPPGTYYKSHLGQLDGLVPLRRCQGEETVRSVLIPVIEIIKEIQLRVVVIHQLEFVVPVVG